MQTPAISFTPEALAFLGQQPGAGAITVAAQFVTSCCGPNLPPQVTVGPPADATGFLRVSASGYDVYVDSLLEPPPHRLVIDLTRYAKFSELTLRTDRPA